MNTLLPPQDKVAVRVITVGVVVAMLFSIVAVFVLILFGHDPKDILPLATGALGLAGGFLARTSTEPATASPDDPPTPVVVTPDQQPIPVEPVDDGGGGGGDPPAIVPVDGGGDESGGEPAAARLRTHPRRGGTRG